MPAVVNTPDDYDLVHETGEGVANANTYVSLDEANNYLKNSLGSATWDKLLADQKASLLIAASRWLDQQSTWNGTPRVAGQALRWPREGACDRDNLPVDPFSIPAQLREAVCEISLFFATPENNPAAYSDLTGYSEITVDVITLKFQDGHNPNATKFLPGLNTLLRGLGRVNTAQGRGFAPIQRV